MAMKSPLPVRNGVGATRLHLPSEGPWATVFDYMIERFFHIAPEMLQERFDKGEIVRIDGTSVQPDAPIGSVDFVWYYREPAVEKEIPFVEDILYVDNDLVVIDKPHFLPTTPGGKYLQNSALVRLRNRLNNPDLTPIHRLDRATAGLLLFSARPATRGSYQLLFENRKVEKVYEAVSALPASWNPEAPALGGMPFPIVYRNHIEKIRAHVRVRVDENREPNAETLIELLGYDEHVMHTLLKPHSGKMHQLRVHLSALGAGILHDSFYPDLLEEAPDDHARPLQLLARELHFVDPLTGEPRSFRSQLRLQDAPVSQRPAT